MSKEARDLAKKALEEVASARRAYEATALALKALEEAIALALKALEEAIDLARKAYEEVIASMK